MPLRSGAGGFVHENGFWLTFRGVATESQTFGAMR